MLSESCLNVHVFCRRSMVQMDVISGAKFDNNCSAAAECRVWWGGEGGV